MSQWKKVSIADVATVVTGKTPSTAKPEYYGGSIPFVAPGDLGKVKYIRAAEKTLTREGGKYAPTIPAGSTLFTCIGATIGKIGIADTELRTNQQINAVIPKAIEPEYLYYALSHMSERIKQIAGVQAVPIIKKSEFEKQAIVIPEDKPTQRAIASTLRTWDIAIEKTEALIAAKEYRFGWLARKLIAKHSNRYTERLGNVSRMSSGGTPKSTVAKYYGGHIPWVSIADMTEKGMWIDSTQRTLTQDGISSSSAKIFPKNTVLFAMYASIGECSIANVELSSSQAILGIIPDPKKLDHEYLYYYLSSLKEKIGSSLV